MELRDIEYFAVIADHGNLGRAAEALGLSHPALSKSLRRLESAVEAKLVRRTPKGVELTAEGNALLGRARELRLSFQDMSREIRDIGSGRGGRLRLGIAPGIDEVLVGPSCGLMRNEAPRVTVMFTSATNDVLVPSLLNGEYDLIVSGIPARPQDGILQEALYEDEFVVFVSPRHPLARRKAASLAELARESWVLSPENTLSRRRLVEAFAQHGLGTPCVAAEANSAAARLRIVMSSDLLGFGSLRAMEQSSTVESAVAVPVKEIAWSRRVGVSYRSNAYVSPAARRFIDILKRVAATVAERSSPLVRRAAK
jgi:DNA-binding transcriptional LysR family regulator